MRADSATPSRLESDADLCALWLASRGPNTRRAYEADAHLFLAKQSGSLPSASALDVVSFAVNLNGAPATRARRIASVRSLLGFAFAVGYTRTNLAVALKVPRVTDALHSRILSEEEVAAVVAELAPGRDRTLGRFLYASGGRLGEVLRLRWADLRGARVHFLGKGERARVVVVPVGIAAELQQLRSKHASDAAFVFTGRGEGQLSLRQARRLIETASLEALGRRISPHWLRHAHGSHALDHGAPVHLVREALGHARLSTTLRYLHVRPDASSGAYLPLCG
jgi:integrase/recombinase XerD